MDAEGLGLGKRRMDPRQSQAISATLGAPAHLGLGRSTLDTAKQMLRARRAAPRPPSPPAETLGEDRASPSEHLVLATPRGRRGRLLLWKDGELVVEMEADGAAFDPADITAARVQLEDGQVLRAHVDVARSTPAGRPVEGLWLRLTFRVDAASGASVRRVTFLQDSITWVVML
jgi:hypothetical protein